MTVPVTDRIANTVLRQARLNLGMSQSEFAKAVRDAGAAAGEPNGANKRLVQKWESGEHAACRPHYARALAAVTGVSARELGLSWVGEQQRGSDAEDLAWRVAWPGAAAAHDSALRLRVALEPPRHTRPEDVSTLQQLSERLFTLEQTTPARELLPTAERQLTDIAAILAGTSAKRTRRVLTLAGTHTALVAARLAADCGDLAAAGRYLQAAMAAAQAAGDEPLWAFIATYAASDPVHGHNPRYGWHLVHGAMQRAGELPQVRAWVAVRAAQEAARCGEHAAALTNLETVATLEEKIGDTPLDMGAPPWAREIDRAVLAAMAARAYATLGDDQAAFEHAERAAHLVTGEPVKWRAVVLTEAACAAARLGRTTRAERWALEARILADRLQCADARRKLDAITARPRTERPAARPRLVGQQTRQRPAARTGRT